MPIPSNFELCIELCVISRTCRLGNVRESMKNVKCEGWASPMFRRRRTSNVLFTIDRVVRSSLSRTCSTHNSRSADEVSMMSRTTDADTLPTVMDVRVEKCDCGHSYNQLRASPLK